TAAPGARTLFGGGMAGWRSPACRRLLTVPEGPDQGSAEGSVVAHQSLYRRYRPQRFAEVRGQDHVTRALRNSVRDGRTTHAYLFSGPRGTGKTSTARILAMALNCAAPSDGEPDGTCPSCVAIRQGSSVDVHELDAASNRKLDEMRDLLARVALGTPGRWKVYIVDEVHQLTPDAASALLKTLEEPPAHVVFVLATTDPQRVLPTIRSRTQHFEFRLLPADVLASLLSDVNAAADLGVPPEAIDLVVRRGHGSARDALSVLDQVVAAGSADDESGLASGVVDGLADRDAGRVLLAVAEAISAGRDPRRLAADILEHLRNGFLATQARGLVLLADDAAAEVEAQARRLGPARLVRAMELVGQASADMRDAVDPRITLEMALVRSAVPGLSTDPADLLTRIEHLERTLGKGAPVEVPSSAPPARGAASVEAVPDPGRDRHPPSRPAPVRPRAAPSGPEAPLRSGVPPPPPPPGAPSAGAVPVEPPPVQVAPLPPAPGAPATAPGGLPTREELTKAWGDRIVTSLRPGVKVYLLPGRFVAVDDQAATFALPDKGLLARAEPVRAEAEQALAAHFGRPIPLRLMLDPGAGLRGSPGSVREPGSEDDPSTYRLEEMEEARPAVVSPEKRLMEAFPGAEEVDL
ncbi:MAG: DNA polymerase III subunit gamma/tau, partial [Acidimicrobiales bacterium]